MNNECQCKGTILTNSSYTQCCDVEGEHFLGHHTYAKCWVEDAIKVNGQYVKSVVDLYRDGVGRLKLLDVMGDQWQPAEDARTSTNKGRLGPEKDLALLNRLIKDGHTSPLEGVVIKVEATVPIYVARELERHRTLGKLNETDLIEMEVQTVDENLRKWFARNEMSGRYVQMPNDYYHPAARAQSKTNKQGGGEDQPSIPPEVAEEFTRRGKEVTKVARELYDWAIEQGIERGVARNYNLQNQYTKIRYTGSLKNWLDFLHLRLPNVVLWECRRVAEALEELLQKIFPDVLKLWRDKVHDAVVLSASDAKLFANALWNIDVTAEVFEHTNNPEDHKVFEILQKLRGDK